MTIEELRKVRPEIAITVERQIDEDAKWDFDYAQPVFAVAYVWTVTAYAIVDGMLHSGVDYLGNSWYNDPNDARTDEDIHGYLPQMIDKAVDGLDENLRLYKEKTNARHN